MRLPFLKKAHYSCLAVLISLSVNLLFLQSCDTQKPIILGYVGGLTGRVADLGTAGRDGAILAVEEVNSSGGINGRPLRLVIRDDRQNAETAVKADAELIAEGASAIIGHMTSSMSIKGVDVINEKHVLMMSPTTSTNKLTGIDDYFFRVYPASAESARRMAQHVFYTLQLKNMAVLYDLGNRAYTESLYSHFKKEYEKYGGNITEALSYTSGPDIKFLALAERLEAAEPEGIFILANAMDTAMLCQQLHKLGKTIPVVTGEWSVTQDVLRFGGKAVEGIQFYHTFDRENQNPRFLQFKDSFTGRFGYEPGFASTHAYDAAFVLIESMKKNMDLALLKETILSIATFQGLQGSFTFDRYGDVERELFLMTIKDGRFTVVQ